jgi:F0F1-type ATP synthase delta subunit
MQKATSELSIKLLERIHSATTLKLVSDTLEDLSQNKAFKEHATNIATDPHLTKTQKRTQLLYLIRSIELPLLYQFFSEEFHSDQFWLFSGGRIDYFDKFVQEFQKATETCDIVPLETSLKLTSEHFARISKSLSDHLGRKVIINHKLNPSLLGGLKIKIDHVYYDYSLQTRFLQFQRAWLKSLKETDAKIGRNVPSDF